jgi:hypothetical protein
VASLVVDIYHFPQTPGYLAPVRLNIFVHFCCVLLFSIPAVGASPHTDIQHPIYFQELEQGFAYDSKADMFGLGCLGFELARLRSGLIFFLFRMS